MRRIWHCDKGATPTCACAYWNTPGVGLSICTHAPHGARMQMACVTRLPSCGKRRGGESCKMSTNSKQGFDCKFVEPPPAALQTDCPICLLVLREPYQVTCCGKSYCKSCIVCVIRAGKPCPCCLQDINNHFPNKGLQQPLYGFKVHCTHAESGCEWIGELGQLSGHLNIDPVSRNKQLEGCGFTHVQCIHCSESYRRHQLAIHQESLCDNRPFICELCNEFESTYLNVVHNHRPVCGYQFIECTYGCGLKVQRRFLTMHLDRECPLASVDCEFKYAGCDMRPSRKDMPVHLQQYTHTHLRIVSEYYRRQLENATSQFQRSLSILESKVERLQAEKDGLELELKEAKCIRVSDEMQILPVTFTIDRYFQRKSHSHQTWISDHFYTSERGYALYLRVLPGGSGPLATIAEYMSVYVHTMKGEFDKYLQWPLRRRITIQLLSQDSEQHHSRTLLIELSKESSAGIWDFAYSAMLESRFLKNNSVKIRVS